MWKDGDDQILEEQLMQLADYILDNQLYNSGCTCTFFDDALGSPYKDEDLYKTFCGAGKMLALSADGDIYPCLRYYGHSLDHHASWPIGNLEYGIDMEKVPLCCIWEQWNPIRFFCAITGKKTTSVRFTAGS